MPLDETEFVDRDYELGRGNASSRPAMSAPPPSNAGGGRRAPSPEELDHQLSSTQQQLARLQEARDQLERTRSAVEELRRRQMEFRTGRGEMLDELHRGVAVLEKVELDARRDAEQSAKTLAGLRESLQKIEAIDEQTWTEEDVERQLSRALAVVHDGRMEWNSARMKWPVLEGKTEGGRTGGDTAGGGADGMGWTRVGFGKLAVMGLAMTWPIALVVLVGMTVMILMMVRR